MKKKKVTLRQKLKNADDIYLTQKHIAVTTVKSTSDKYGGGSITQKTQYVPKTQKTMAILNTQVGTVRKGK